MNDIITIKGVRGYLDANGTAQMNLEDIARGLGFTQTQNKNGVEYTSVRWERVEQHLAEMGFPHKWGKDDFIPESIFYWLAMKAKNEAAQAFQALIADEILPSIRKTGGYIMGQDAMSPEELMVTALQVAQKTLNGPASQKPSAWSCPRSNGAARWCRPPLWGCPAPWQRWGRAEIGEAETDRRKGTDPLFLQARP